MFDEGDPLSVDYAESNMVSRYGTGTDELSVGSDGSSIGSSSAGSLAEQREIVWKFRFYRKDGNCHVIGEWYSNKKTYSRTIVIGPDHLFVLFSFLILLGTTIPTIAYMIHNKSLKTYYIVVVIISFILLMIMVISDPGLVRPYRRARNPKWTYCDRCECFRPPDCIHCATCAVCVSEYDHHCPWTGKCIGGGNKNWFKAFSLSISLLVLSTFIVFIIFLIPTSSSQ